VDGFYTQPRSNIPNEKTSPPTKKRKSILPFNDLDRRLGEGGGKEYQNTGIDGMEGGGGLHLDGIFRIWGDTADTV
jgi:hypothetical protein